jgi:dienelactone hydrolase
VQPDGLSWPAWYGEGLKTIDWARNMTRRGDDPVFALINWAAGVGLAGHSMGGQAVTLAANDACTRLWDIRAVAVHHPASGVLPDGNMGVNVSVPIAGFTSSGDTVCPDTWTEDIVRAALTRGLPVALRDLTGWSHLEPVLSPPIENPLLATFTAAWFKIYLERDSGFYRDLIFSSTSPDSLCQYADMTRCFTKSS